MKLAVTYMRMSTDKQEHSIDSQERLIKTFAKQNDFHILHNYVDEGISGRNAEKRPQFMQMIEDSAKGNFQHVIIYDSSRFARNLEQSLIYKSILKKNQVTLVSITEPSLDDDTSLITDALFGAMNEMYSRKLSKNVKRGMEQKALRGEFCGNEPFGYDYNKAEKRLVPNPVESPIAKYILAEILAGRTPYSIAMEMRDKNIKTKAGITVERRRIDYMVRNPVYKGYIRWSYDNHLIVQKSTHEPLISEESYEKIQEILDHRSNCTRPKSRPSQTHTHWLSGILYCDECNCVYTFVRARAHENKKARFRCSGQSRARCSSGISFTVETLEKQVFMILQEIIQGDNNLYSLNIQQKVAPAINYDNDIKKLNLSLDRAKKAFLEGIDSLTEYGETKKNILTEIEKLEVLQNQKNNKKIDMNKFRACLTDLVTVLKGDCDPQLKKDAFKNVIEKIIIEKQTRNITLYFFP